MYHFYYGLADEIPPDPQVLLSDDALDYGLDAFLIANKILVCIGFPRTYAQANNQKLGAKDMGIGGVIASGPVDASPSGRKITTAAVSNGPITTNGTPQCWAIIDEANTRLLATGVMTGSEAYTTMDAFNLEAFTINLPAGP